MTELILPAVTFYEAPGPGYVFISQLTGGVNAFAYLVKSLPDGKLYVRKQFNNLLKQGISRGMSSLSRTTVLLNPQPEVIPQVHKIQSRQLASGGHPGSPYRLCDEGNMGMLLEDFWQEKRPLPEVFIWHFLARMAEIVAGLQLGWTKGRSLPLDQRPQKRSVVYHADLHASSVFLNWSSDTYTLLLRSS
jgi:hypothetical protein